MSPAPKKAQGARRTTGLAELEREHAGAQLAYARAVSEALAGLNQQASEAQGELVATLRDLQTRVAEAQDASARALTEKVQGVLGDAAPGERCSAALKAYHDAARAVAEAQANAGREAQEAYERFAWATQLGDSEEELRGLGERAQESYLAALRTASPTNELVQRAREAEVEYARALEEARTGVLSGLADAFGAQAGKADTPDEKVAGEYEAALQRYQERVTGLNEGLQRTLLEAQIGALRQMESAWAKLAPANGGRG
jgi:hypothetical protein